EVLPFVGGEHAGEHLDQRALAGAVVAQQAVHLSAGELQRHAGQRDHRAEVLRDVLELQDHVGHAVCSQRRPSATRRRTQLLNSTATSSMPPRKTRYQLLSMLV